MHRCETYFHALRPFFAPIANSTPALLVKKRRPYATAGGNSTSVRARYVQTRLNGGASVMPFANRSRCGSCP